MGRAFGGWRVCLVWGVIAAMGAAHSVRAQEKDQSPLVVSIAAPAIRGKRELRLGNNLPRFFVVIRNVSDHPVNIYGEHSSFGAYNLTFEITAIGDETLDKPRVVTREWGLISWNANFPYAETLEPGEATVREACVRGDFESRIDGNDFTYRPFPLPDPGGTLCVRMCAVFTEKVDPRRRLDGEPPSEVWTGQIFSPPLDFEVRRY